MQYSYPKKKYKKATSFETVEQALARGVKVDVLPELTHVSIKEAHEFYDTLEWRKKSLEIRQRDKKCANCGSEHFLNCDHIKPLRYFWHLRLEESNLQTLCSECNRHKGNLWVVPRNAPPGSYMP